MSLSYTIINMVKSLESFVWVIYRNSEATTPHTEHTPSPHHYNERYVVTYLMRSINWIYCFNSRFTKAINFLSSSFNTIEGIFLLKLLFKNTRALTKRKNSMMKNKVTVFFYVTLSACPYWTS